MWRRATGAALPRARSAGLPAAVAVLAAGTGAQLAGPLPPEPASPAEAKADEHGSYAAVLEWAGGSAALLDLAHGRPLPRPLLRRIVLRLKGCLGALDSRPATVLALETGIGMRRSFGRAAVAAMLGVTMAQEGRLQRAAVLALADAASDGLCGAVASGGVNGLLVPFSGLPWQGQMLVTAVAASPASGAPRPAALTAPAPPSQTTVPGIDPGRSNISSSAESIDWLIFAVALLALATGMLAFWRISSEHG